ncbi:tyrosine-type recombinase/integrase [Leptospira stimsonii]|uniref:Site-specific integrase n=1 Tax=Leptospira stimsonii TaxID=2202203 RepID=A0ABY2NA64_9LEPT|nr:tyrosine-type recombinase/integrase [Leptospira stimsonii]TGK19039.1 site-specific integrase [Leptospira stimsonii]TGM18984.1 site-specific integrase [Leptospira stimsonii]
MNSNTAKILSFESIKKKNRKNASGSPPSSSNGFAKGLSKQTMNTLLKRFSDPLNEESFRNRAIFLFMSQTGLRAKEVVNSRFSNLLEGPSGETLLKYIKKGGGVGYSVLSSELIAEIRAYHFRFEIKSDFFFQSLPKRHQSHRSPLSKRGLQFVVSSWRVKTCQGRNIHCHALRHTVGIKLLAEAGSIAAQKVLGHSSPVTTSKFYTQPFYDGSRHLKSWE